MPIRVSFDQPVSVRNEDTLKTFTPKSRMIVEEGKTPPFSISVPNGTMWYVELLYLRFAMSAVVANRVGICSLQRLMTDVKQNILYQFFTPTLDASRQQYARCGSEISFQDDGTQLAPANIYECFRYFPRGPLMQGDSIGLNVFNAQAGDTIDADLLITEVSGI